MGFRDPRAQGEVQNLAGDVLDTGDGGSSIKGKSAFLNFPHITSSLLRSATLSSRDIQAATATAAGEFLMPSEDDRSEDRSLDPVGTNNVTPIRKDTVILVESRINEEAAGACAFNSSWISSLESEGMILNDDILFDLPNLLGNMAEGLLASPPWLVEQEELNGNNYAADNIYDGSEPVYAEASLWSYS